MTFWQIVRVIKTRLWLILSVVAITTTVIFIAAPKPKIAYKAAALVQPTPQVMMGGGSTATEGNKNIPDRAVILSNLIILAQSGDVYQKAMDFLALPVEEQRKQAPDLPDYKQITRIELSPGELLTYGKWVEVIEVVPVNNPSVGERGTTTDIIQLSVKLPPSGTAPYLA
ncbi:MAG: hypothetical protein SNJ70_03835, partial [Armatimonadota bacterium]